MIHTPLWNQMSAWIDNRVCVMQSRMKWVQWAPILCMFKWLFLARDCRTLWCDKKGCENVSHDPAYWSQVGTGGVKLSWIGVAGWGAECSIQADTLFPMGRADCITEARGTDVLVGKPFFLWSTVNLGVTGQKGIKRSTFGKQADWWGDAVTGMEGSGTWVSLGTECNGDSAIRVTACACWDETTKGLSWISEIEVTEDETNAWGIGTLMRVPVWDPRLDLELFWDWEEHDQCKWWERDAGLPTCPRSHKMVVWMSLQIRISPITIMGVPPIWRGKMSGGSPCFQVHSSSRIKMDWIIWRCHPSCWSKRLRMSSRAEIVSSSNEEMICWMSSSVKCNCGLRCSCKRQGKSRRRRWPCQCGIKQIVVVPSSLEDEFMMRNAQNLSMITCNWMQALMVKGYGDIGAARSNKSVEQLKGYLHDEGHSKEKK